MEMGNIFIRMSLDGGLHIGLNLAFYYIDNDTCYGLHTESLPIEFKILPMDKSQKNTCWQCEFDTHDNLIKNKKIYQKLYHTEYK